MGGGGGVGGNTPVPPFSPPPPPPWHCTWSHNPWVPYYQTLWQSSINYTSIWKIYQNWPLTFDLHLDGLHRYDPQSIIKIPTKLYHNWTLLPGPRCIKLSPEFFTAKTQETPAIFFFHCNLHKDLPEFFYGEKKSLAKSFMQRGPGVITSCKMALYLYIGYAHCKICAHMYIVYIATFLKL